ncbi:hypothetical protein ACIPLR_19540 [Herbaspirillum huttiense]|uniref:hypothetical protein n=1 Tax=Herbaspirillum huttiense TaxID=863372 RepID=UPI003809A86C
MRKPFGYKYLSEALFGASLFFPFSACWADVPLAVEGLLTESGRLRLDVSLSYANVEKQKVSTGEYLEVQTGPTSFVFVPTKVTDGTVNNDIAVGTLGLKYGIRDGMEIYGRASWFVGSYRNSESNGNSQNSGSGISDVWIGSSYRFPGNIIVSAETALLEKYNSQTSSFKSLLLSVTSYKSIDPVVLSATGTYKYSAPRHENRATYKSGNYFLLNPSLGFSVNEKVSLTTGLQWTLRFPEQFNGIDQSYRHTRTDLLLGMAYAIDRESIINFSLKSNVSGRNGADLRAVWIHTFP